MYDTRVVLSQSLFILQGLSYTFARGFAGVSSDPN